MSQCSLIKEYYERLQEKQSLLSNALQERNLEQSLLLKTEIETAFNNLKELLITPQLQELKEKKYTDNNGTQRYKWIKQGEVSLFPPEQDFFNKLAKNESEFDKEGNEITQFHTPDSLFSNYDQLFKEDKHIVWNPNTDTHYLTWLNNQPNTRAMVMDYIHSGQYATDNGYTPVLPHITCNTVLYDMLTTPESVETLFKHKDPSYVTTNTYFFPGSAVHSAVGDWNVPYGYWNEHTTNWFRNGYWVCNDWDSDERVLLFRE